MFVKKCVEKRFGREQSQPVKFRTPKNSKPIPVLLDEALRDRIAAVSKKMGEPQSTVMRISMRIGLDQLEELLWKDPEAIAIRTARADEVNFPQTKKDYAAGDLQKPALNEADDGGPTAKPPSASPPAGPISYRKQRRKREK